MAQDLISFTRKRESIKEQLVRLENYFEEFKATNSEDFEQLRARVKRGRDLLSQFESLQMKIERVDDSDEQKNEFVDFENRYFNVIPGIDSFLKRKVDNQPNTSISSQVTASESQTINVRLPTINLPTFNGAYDEWLGFRDTFVSLVHANDSLPAIQKFHYLRASLKGEAARTLQSLEISAGNYEAAWSILKQRFENHRLITQQHVRALFELQPVNKECSSALRHLSDAAQSHLRALEALQEPVQHWDTLLIFLITSKLDGITKREWETVMSNIKSPSMKQLNEFLAIRCQLLENLSPEKQQIRTISTKLPQERSRCHLLTQKSICPCCNKTHHIATCETFLAMSPFLRIKEIQKYKLCINCLRQGHFIKKCPAGSCRKCGKRHNTLLHNEETNTTTNGQTETKSAVISATISTHHAQHSNPHVLLSTAVVRIFDNKGQGHHCRVLLDSGSQSHFITENMCKRLNLKREKISTPISGINSVPVTVHEQATVKIQSCQNKYQAVLRCLILQQITDQLPPVRIPQESFCTPANINLADPQFNVPGNIDMLIGAALFWDLMCIGQIKLSRLQPFIMQKTKLGWIIWGTLPGDINTKFQKRCNLSISHLETQLQKFWEIEEITTENGQHLRKPTVCEEHFTSNLKRHSDGKFIVRLPLTGPREDLGESRNAALKRLCQVERKLQRDPQLETAYQDFMKEYLRLDHMEEVLETESSSKRYYMPHHGVLKTESLTTKLRVVFDASAKTSSGQSLNDIMMVGPTIQQDLLSITLRFRMHRYALTADIAKMFRQIWMSEEDRKLQTILWRTSSTDAVKTYQLKTVTYGTAAASFLATRCLEEVAKLEENSSPLVAKIIRRDFYMDDLLTGADTIEEAIILKQQVEQALKCYGFELRKWCSNNPQLLQFADNETIELKTVTISNGDQVKTLGLGWEPANDILRYGIKEQMPEKYTKRQILLYIAQVFDPLGLLGPIVITAKIIMQKLWQEKLNWDESLPIYLHTAWENYHRQLSHITTIKIPRAVIQILSTTQIDLHGFCDASESAYGAAIYIRASNEAGEVCCNLLCAKTRVAPVKQISLPRLELCGALLLAQLFSKVKNSIQNLQKIYFWTDSMIVLSWLNGEPSQWQTFVANRVAQIQNITITRQWRHVNTKTNPADLLTRGVTTEALIDNLLWWNGPYWLQRGEDEWPAVVSPKVQTTEQRIKRVPLVTIPAILEPQLCERFSTLTRALRIAAYCKRFLHNAKMKQSDRKTGPLTVFELQGALHMYIRQMQVFSYAEEYRLLSQGKEIQPTSKLRALNPLLDEFDLLQVSGRLANAPLSDRQKKPWIISANHHLTKLIVQEAHKKQLHAGAQATLAAVRQQYWPINGRSTIRKYIRGCLTCYKQKPNTIMPQMGQLPAARVKPTRPFYNVGVDYAGPIYLKTGTKRSKTLIKGYIVVFICFATKAIHLEAVTNLTSEAFIAALRRFAGRRGVPGHIHSDNGTTFVGAKKELNELAAWLRSSVFANEVINQVVTDGIQWHFIPPHSPHFGGLWEAGVKSVKYHLRRITQNANVSFEEISTLLIQIEAVLNSRPLCPLTNDPNDLAALTPSHFLIGQPLTAVPDANLEDTPINRLSRWQYIQRLTQQFWKLWLRDYIPQLQTRVKWQRLTSTGLQIGDLVLLKVDNVPPHAVENGANHATASRLRRHLTSGNNKNGKW